MGGVFFIVKTACFIVKFSIKYTVVSLLVYIKGDYMAKKEYPQGSYGAYLVDLIRKKEFTQEKFAKELKVSKTYLFDVFNGRLKPPAPDMQDRIIATLQLSDTEQAEFYNKSAEGRNELPKDIFDYLKGNTAEINLLRERMRV